MFLGGERMDKQDMDEKIVEASKSVLGYCLARTPSREDAEDLAQDILLEMMKSLPNIRNAAAFYGFMWTVAGRVYAKWYRTRLSSSTCELKDDLRDERNWHDEEDEASDLFLLRRELRLLSEKYRRATILYYLENKSCAEIAGILSVSESMVKYLLFKSRKLLKEGMSMERNYGEQSYQPKRLELLFWGNGPNRYYSLCSKLIPQNILFACYNDSITAEQIALEIGVGLPYLEEELCRLLEYGLLKKEGNRYAANIVIFTKDFTTEVDAKTADVRREIAETVKQTLMEKEEDIRKIGFSGADMSGGVYAWQMTCILLYQAIIEKLENRIQVELPVDKFGTPCFVWGAEVFERDTWSGGFGLGISNVVNAAGDRVQFMDFPINGEMVHPYFFNRQDITNVFLAAAAGKTEGFNENDRAAAAEMVRRGYLRSTGGKLAVNVPVFTKDQFVRLTEILNPAADQVERQAEKQLGAVTKILLNHVPVHLKKTAKDMAYLRLFEDALSAPAELLYREGFLHSVSGMEQLPTTYVILNSSKLP